MLELGFWHHIRILLFWIMTGSPKRLFGLPAPLMKGEKIAQFG